MLSRPTTKGACLAERCTEKDKKEAGPRIPVSRDGNPPADSGGRSAVGPALDLGGMGVDLGKLMGALSAMQGTEDRVLNALRPSLSQEGQSRVDRALRAAKLSRLAGQFLSRRGGSLV